MTKQELTDAEQAVVAATQKFYDGLEAMISGKGGALLEDAWHHTEQVTSRHPVDDWSLGWEEVAATWSFVATFGREDRGGSKVLGIIPRVYGDTAYASVMFQAAPAWGGEKMGCTNVLAKKDGVWKIVHHHADPSPAMQAALEKMIAES